MSAIDQQNFLIRELSEIGILPLFYHDEPSVCIAVTRALYRAGIRYIEFTNRGKKAMDNFQLLIREKNASMPDLLLGVGTIKSTSDAQQFIEAGAGFLVSPVMDEEISILATNNEVAWIPGCMTPTEIYTAERAGCGLVKLFPGNILGTGFVEAVKVLFPSTKFIVTGGVDANEESISSWLNSGVIAVGLGSKLITTEILNEGNMDQLTDHTRELLDKIKKRKKQ